MPPTSTNSDPRSGALRPGPRRSALDAAFEALTPYEQGSSRAALLPIDQAVTASLDNKTVRRELEPRLLGQLATSRSAVAREYICSKLALIGSDLSVPALASLLDLPDSATAARNALEVIPGRQATKALRLGLSKVQGLQKIGVINSLGVRRDDDSVSALAALLHDSDPRIVAAALGALGAIATTRAAKCLCQMVPKLSQGCCPGLADALLTCAQRLLADGKKTDAGNLYRTIAGAEVPEHVRRAAARGMEAVSRR